MFQEISNDIMNSSIQWVLSPKITLYKFGSPSRLQLPKWELIWECVGLFPHTLLHSWEHEMWLWASFLARTFASPYLGCEPNSKVATPIFNPPQIWDLMWNIDTIHKFNEQNVENPIDLNGLGGNKVIMCISKICHKLKIAGCLKIMSLILKW